MMKHFKWWVAVCLVMLLPCNAEAQAVEYQTFIYTSEKLSDEIAMLSAKRDDSRGLLGDMLKSSANAMKGIGTGYVSSFIDLGVNAIGQLISRNSRQRKEWEEMVKKENVFQTAINSVAEMNDFYDEPSFDGAMDPKGMRFNGIGCLRKEGRDTTFYISCHLDRSKLYRVINHSKFELVLDTLILSPAHSNLPNTKMDIPYSFEDRKDFTLSMDITLSSSWMNEIVELQKDQVLGTFNIRIPVDKSLLDGDGYLRYTRADDEVPRYRVTGESFIVPRSYMGFRDSRDNFKDCWGTGEYKVGIVIKETCDVTEQYRKRWKEDYKHRRELEKKDKQMGLLEHSWQVVSNQKWDELAQSWVITTLRAPADVITTELNKKLGAE